MQDAINYAEKYRYKKDIVGNLSTPISYKLDFVENNLARNSLSINEEMLPSIEKILYEVCNNLFLDRKLVKGYIYSSNELQAYCYSTNKKECIIQISSRLIELLDENELMFVVGHEIGHFLLGATTRCIFWLTNAFFRFITSTTLINTVCAITFFTTTRHDLIIIK